MSRGARGFLLAMGGLILFGGLAVAGFAVGNMLDEDGDDATTLVGFPWVRPADGEVEVPAWVAEEQDRTARAVDRSGPPGTETDPIDGIGDPEAGGQMLLVVDTPPDSDVSTGESTSTTGQPGSDAGRSSPAAPLPSEVFYDIPELIGLVDLSDVEIADPVGSVDVDLCAGPERLPETPAGCPAGFGGTIVPFDGGIGGGADTGDQSGRPPTGLTGSGTDVLSVRTFRRSAQPEEVGVSVVEWDGSWAGPENGCDPAAVTAEGRALPEMQRFAVTTIPIEGTSDPELWPWDPAYDTLEVFRFGLEPGTAYAVCVYWLDISGTDPRVASWEATQVVTASGRRFTLELISWDTYSLDNAHPITEEVEEFAVRGDCTGGTRARFNWPGEGTRSVLEPPWRLCDVSHLSGVLQQGGLQVDVELTLTIRGTLVTRIFNGWLPISRSDIFCRVDCVTAW